MQLLSNLQIIFTFYGLGIIAVSLFIGNLINKRILKRNKKKSQ